MRHNLSLFRGANGKRRPRGLVMALVAGPALALGVFATPASAGQVVPEPNPHVGIVNGGFETGAAGFFTGSLSGWTNDAYGAISVVPGGYPGYHAAKVGDDNNAPSGSNTTSYISQQFVVPLGEDTLSFWYDTKCPQTGGAQVDLMDFTTNTSTVPLQQTCVADSGWTKVSVPVVPGHHYDLSLDYYQWNVISGGLVADTPGTTLYDDITLSGPPTGVSLWNECGRGDELDWNSAPGAVSYNVYARKWNGVAWLTTKVASNVQDTHYDFGSPLNETYTVTSVRTDGSESAQSAGVSNAQWDEGAC